MVIKLRGFLLKNEHKFRRNRLDTLSSVKKGSVKNDDLHILINELNINV